MELMLLVGTSHLFATVVVHAHYRRCDAYHHLFLAVTVLSVLFHATKDARVGRVDKGVAHAAFLYVLVRDGPQAVRTGQAWLLGFPLLVTVLWFVQPLFPERAERLHACLHLVAAAGLHMFMAWLYCD